VTGQMPKWTTFDRRSRPIADEAYVTIQRRGTFSFNQTARTAIGNPEAVELLYDVDERLIGFRPVDPSNPRAYRLRKQGHANNWILGGQAFTKTFRINTDTAKRYLATVDDGVLVVDLKQPGSDATGVRLKRSDG
jgi:hypothetical protein